MTATPEPGNRDPLLCAVLGALSYVYQPEGVGIWMNSPNRNLDGQRPSELIAAGEAERVLAEAERIAGRATR